MTPSSTASTTLLRQFGLTTAAEELVPRLKQAGHHDALPALVEVFEAEAEARRQRRIARLRRASRLPPGKTFATLDTGRLPAPVVQQLKTLATGAFLETATKLGRTLYRLRMLLTGLRNAIKVPAGRRRKARYPPPAGRSPG